MSREALDHLGRFIMQHLRDAAFETTDRLVAGEWKAPALQPLQHELAALSGEQRELVRRCCRRVVDGAIHDFLFALAEETDRGSERVVLLVDGQNAAALSDGLQGEPFEWRSQFSRYGESPENA
ncbi:hypothetical protein [Anaeromyxobacter diazotrophicus]|uniref:Uncharacterized protein n=1 Tax=Anaeromyxobacter diazotrophicus TaxID=2590199 RepID=A0A7I9VT29_9BACT|nr:hypothetical protein [Anaeromyxobacter diazotrophicus]GEJ59249.1 hypothetical protein AMYX_39900 [Anaeromyxobacter diazotrophicus]